MNTDRLIRTLLRLYPAAFRQRYGAAMLDFHRERVRAGLTVWAWLRIIVDHLVAAIAEHTRSATHNRSSSRSASLSTLLQDLHFTWRALLHRRLFTAIVLVTIALGVGANTAIFSVVHGILIRPLPYPAADRVVAFGHEPPMWLASQPEYFDYKTGLRSFESLAAFTQSEGNLASEEEPERVALANVTLDFFDVLGVRPVLGRTFARDEDVVAPAEVIIVSHALWQRRFAGDPTVVGRTVLLNGRTRTVIGVMPRDFDYPTEHTDIWLPLRRMQRDSLGDRANHYLFLVGRLQQDMTLDRATDEAHMLARRMVQEHSDRYDPKYPPTPVITRVNDALVGSTRPYLWALFGAVGFMLLIVCANVANLLLARGEGRRKEMALRGALGASRGRLMTQLLIESLALAVTGGVLGVFLAWSALRALVALAPPALPRIDQVGLHGVVLAYAMLLSVMAGLIFGVLPALRVSREAPAEMLKQGGRSSRQGSSRRMRRSLVVAEVALAVIMLSGAGMLLRSLINLQSASLGFEPRSTLTAKVSLTAASYDNTRSILFYSQLLERVRAIPGVQHAGASGWLPVVEAGGLWGVLAEGQGYETVSQGPTAEPQQVTPGYFAAMGIPLLSGRDFNEHDGERGPYVGIVSESLARELWRGEDALGKRFRLGGGAIYVTVVGIVGDTRSRGFDDAPEPTMYFPYAQTAVSAYFMPRSMSLVMRTAGDPMNVAPAVRALVRALDAGLPVSSVRTLSDVVGTSVASRRFSTTLITTFALLALLLAGIGIFGVVSYSVTERTYEIGVRVALGAERSSILSLVIVDSARMALAGIALGLLGAAAVARAIRSMLVDVPLLDVPTLLGVCATLIAVVLVATALPARRATSVDPTNALRAG